MPLQQLYTTSPMADYDKLSLGLVLGMGQEGFEQARQRQDEYDRIVQAGNRQVIDEYNPAEISRMELANQQQDYMMPTYEAQGMGARAKTNTPGYYDASAQAELAGFGATKAENVNKQVGAEALAPFVKPTTEAKALTEQEVSQMTNLYNLLGDPRALQAPDAEVMKWVNGRMPNQAKAIQAGIKQAGGWAKYAPLYRESIRKRLEEGALIDPAHMQKVEQEAAIPRTPPAFSLGQQLYENNLAAGMLPQAAGVATAAALHPTPQMQGGYTDTKRLFDPATGQYIGPAQEQTRLPAGAQPQGQQPGQQGQQRGGDDGLAAELAARKKQQPASTADQAVIPKPRKEDLIAKLNTIAREIAILDKELDKIPLNIRLRGGTAQEKRRKLQVEYDAVIKQLRQ